ncbi:histidine kinase [Flagellimonas hymeniacidonis]|uniref:Histidine kinase n=1 Tax=Flagellimonas hymeniacidonis TaxID=2603628 RepID=A0A5C8V3X4_9FLAO|nr:histidine kinase [Flagellimonas hymeniacidonis]TXN35675.1 histidine kinase [Flagellimonas hymeniacidonis]
MRKLFIHKPLFRLLSPLFSGTLVYLLILLINNTIDELGANFFGQELYVCIGLAYLIQEYSRISIIIFKRLKWPSSFFLKTILQIISTILINIALVSLAMYLYFTMVLYYAPNSRELLIFNSIFSVIALIYVLLYVSHQFLYMVNTEKLKKEEWARQEIEDDFTDFKRGINPELLFESLEAILVVMKKDSDKAEQITDRFAMVYRYLLSKKKDELVPLADELRTLEEFLQLFSELPYRKMQLGEIASSKMLVVPGSLLRIAEKVMRTTIPSEVEKVTLNILESEDKLTIQYKHEEKIGKSLNINDLQCIKRDYKYYATEPVQVVHDDLYKTVYLPKLSLV